MIGFAKFALAGLSDHISFCLFRAVNYHYIISLNITRHITVLELPLFEKRKSYWLYSMTPTNWLGRYESAVTVRLREPSIPTPSILLLCYTRQGSVQPWEFSKKALRGRS